MCSPTCDHPELKPKDGKCSEELIKQCHGTEKESLCTNECDCK